MTETISYKAVRDVVDERLAAGVRVVGPVEVKPGLVQFATLTDSSSLLLNGFVHPANTAKECVLPRHEKLFGYRVSGDGVTLTDQPADPVPTLLIGCRPCDAAAFAIVDKVMNWDFRDSQYNAKRSALTVVTVACQAWDEGCFCTTVGLGPAAGRGSDVLLLDTEDGGFEVRSLTDRGRALMSGRITTGGPVAEEPIGPPPRVDLDELGEALRNSHDSAAWMAEGLRCIGCGACTYTCPTCHCFDIVDESHGNEGCRVRNWDSCQFRMFTLHATGHNPRADQAARQRQRSLHKFVIYPEKFGDYLCTGCGNCLRSCPVGLGVLNMLKAVATAPVGVEGRDERR